MKCESCNSENPVDARYCSTCGQPLASLLEDKASALVECADCGASNPPDSKFCFACGRPLKQHLPARAQETERKPHRPRLGGGRRRALILGVVGACLVLAIGLGLGLGLRGSPDESDMDPRVNKYMDATRGLLEDLVGTIDQDMSENETRQALEMATEIADMADDAYWNVPVPISDDDPYFRTGWTFNEYLRRAATLAQRIYEAHASMTMLLWRSDLLAEASAVDLLRVQFEADRDAGR